MSGARICAKCGLPFGASAEGLPAKLACKCREEAVAKFKEEVEALAKSDDALSDKLKKWAARQVKAAGRASPVCCVHCEGLKEALRNTPPEPEQIEARRRLAEKEAAARAEKGDAEDGTVSTKRRRTRRTSKA